MKNTLITALAIIIIPFSIAHAKTPVETVETTVGQLSEKEALMAELRTLRSLHINDKKDQVPTPSEQLNIDTAAVEHPEFGLKDLYPDAPAPELDQQTKQALRKTQKWLHQTNTPIVKKGRIVHPYGSGIPTLVLEPLALSNIMLAADETIVSKGIQLGDQENWSVKETYIGSRGNKRPNLIVKSTTLDEMKTVLIIGTTKRVYHIQLVSTHGEWTPQLCFSYPENGVERSPETLNRLMNEQSNAALTAASEAPEPRDSYLYAASDIDFGYEVTGDAKILPLRVFGLGHQTVIEMNPSISKINAPALLLEDGEGNEEMVNYDFKDDGHRYILNQPIYKAYLISGVGWDQSKVTIKKLEGK